MTLDEILKLAAYVREHGDSHARILARGVFETLGVGFPCGWARPQTSDDGERVVWHFDDTTTIEMTREEALGIAAALAARALELPEGR